MVQEMGREETEEGTYDGWYAIIYNNNVNRGLVPSHDEQGRVPFKNNIIHSHCTYLMEVHVHNTGQVHCRCIRVCKHFPIAITFYSFPAAVDKY